MAAAGHKTLQLLANKLALGDNETVLCKAAELERLLQSKSLAGSNVTDTAKFVICLDIAATLCGADFDLKTAVKYSGLKAPSYMNSRNTIENLLELNKETLSIPTLCLTLQCTGVQSLAEKILREHQGQAKVDIDLSLPQYVCMAVYHACRLNKVKVSKSKFIEKSRLKSSQWAKLDGEWSKLIDEKFPNVRKKRGRPSKAVADEDEEMTENMELDSGDKAVTEPELESYDDWKRRMLDMAYSEIKLQEKTNTPTRRSPRKTPQKSSPYKENPGKQIKGVRLLFPMC